MKRVSFFVLVFSMIAIVPAGGVFAEEHQAAQETEATAASNTATAADLIADAQRAVGQVVKAARDDTTIPPDGADAKPFWNAMKELNEALEKADTGLTLKDETFFSNLALAVAAVQQAEIALKMNNLTDPAVRQPLTTLSGIVTALDTNYSKEAARLKQGGELTAAERKQLEELNAKQAELDEKLKEIKEKAGKNNDKIQQSAKEIAENSRKIRNARNDVGGFVAAMTAARMMSGMIWGWHWWWGPWGYWGPGFIDINIIVWDDWIDVCPYDWALADEAILVDDLGLDTLDIYGAEVAALDGWLDESDFSLDSMDMMELTDDLPAGWDEVDSDIGIQMMQDFQSDFEHMPFEPQFEPNTFDDFGGMDDFGGGFDDFGGGFDW